VVAHKVFVEVLSGEAAVASEGLDRAPPVSDGRSVTGADFAEKVVEMTETAEEAVVSKTARVKEEVLISKDATERTETVRDTVRREDVEITKDAGIERTAGSTAASTTAPYPKV
jgi:stress response protein YsnF